MNPHRLSYGVVRHGAWVAAIALAVGAGRAAGQAPGQGGRSGGLLPVREPADPSGGVTRAEIMNRYDLDSNGQIDEAEGETARMKMRRSRAEMLQNSGVDPLTGRPRGNSPNASPHDQPTDADDLRLVPGTPANQPPLRKPAPGAEKKPLPKTQSTSSARTPVVTGGVRAGAPAVRPGYGAAGGKRDLNAGRPRDGIPARNGTAQRPTVGAPRPSLFPSGEQRPSSEDFGR